MLSHQVVIIMHNTLAAMGVQRLLNESFDVSSYIATSADEFRALPADGLSLVVTDAQYYAELLKHFLPRQSRTLVVVDHEVALGADNPLIVSSLDTQQLADVLSRYFVKSEHQQNANQLSQREMDVLRLVASGLINKEIADRLNISINTVLSHRKNITTKLGIKSVSGLSFYAMMNGLIDPN